MRAFAIGFLAALACTGSAFAAPSHYDLKARIDPRTGVITAHMTMTLQPADLTPETGFLLGQRFKLSRMSAPAATVPAAPAEVAHLDRVQRIPVKLPARPTRPVTLTLDYSGPLADPEETDGVAFRAPDLMELRLE